MIEQALQIEITDWGIIFNPVPGFELNDKNIFSVIDFTLDKCQARDKSRLLFDETNVKRNVSFFKGIEVVEHFRSNADNPGIYRIAFILQDTCDRTNLRFLENVGYNRGIRIEYFFDRHEAIEWLKCKDISFVDKAM